MKAIGARLQLSKAAYRALVSKNVKEQKKIEEIQRA